MSNADAKFTIPDHTTKALARLPSRHQDSTDFRAAIAVYTDKIQQMEDVIKDIRVSILFDIDTAIGTNQDQIGDILVIAREGRDDAAYRVILRAQALLVLDERRSQRRLMEIVRLLMDGDPGAIMYDQFRPKSFEITTTTISLAQLVSWIPILRRCRPATYAALLGFFLVGHQSYGDATLVVVQPWPGYGDSTLVVVQSWGGYSGAIVL